MTECEDENRCPTGCECPTCGEHNMDKLAIDLDDEDFIDCETCGQRYRVELIAVGQGFRAEPVASQADA
jgi:transcription elongation factor Elf1